MQKFKNEDQLKAALKLLQEFAEGNDIKHLSLVMFDGVRGWLSDYTNIKIVKQLTYNLLNEEYRQEEIELKEEEEQQ